MDTSILEDIGLTNAEIKIYLALLELGSTKAGSIIQTTNLQNSVVHLTLQKLVERGFATYIKKGKIKHYSATNPENIITYLDQKKERFKEILPQLLAKQTQQEKSQAEIYEGFKGFKAMLQEVIRDGKKGDEWIGFSFYTSNPEEYEKIFNYYREFEKERAKKGITVKLIAPRKVAHLVEGRSANIKLVDSPVPLNTAIFRDKVYFTPWENSQTSYLITSKQLAEEYRKFFYELWDKN